MLAQLDTFGSFFWPIVGVMVLIAILISTLALVRRRMFSGQDAEADPLTGFSLSQLRSLVKQGKMTPEEFDAAKAKIVEAAQRSTEQAAPLANLAPEKKAGPTDPI